MTKIVHAAKLCFGLEKGLFTTISEKLKGIKPINVVNLRTLLPLFLLTFYLGISQLSIAQQVAMQGWYWDYPKTGQGYNWSDTLGLKAPSLGQAGFTHVWYPPFAGNGNKSGGYDPKDLYVGPAQTSLGYLDQIKAMVSSFTAAGITPVADMVYNHRDAGALERNDAVKDYITKFASGSGPYGFKSPFPSDRYRMVIPIGGSAAEKAGTYYIKMRSRGNIFNGAKYAFHATTNKIGGSRWSPVLTPDVNLTTSADQFQYTAQLGRNYLNRINTNGDEDEFKVTVTANDFNATGDFLIIQAINYESEYSDHLPIEIWYQSATGGGGSYNIANYLDPFSPNYKLIFQTYTDFNNMPSGLGALDWKGFRPHFEGSSPAGWSQTTSLGPQFSMQSLDYFYDYDHNIPATRDLLIDWTKWTYDELESKGIRMDAVKHFEPSFVSNMLNEMNRTNRNLNMVVGEWYAENGDELKRWVDEVNNGLNPQTKSAVPVKVFDFSLRRALKDALDNGANARQVYFSSLRDAKGMSGFNVMTFLNNHDFRSSNPSYGDALIHHNPILGYAYLLTNNQLGVPTVFYPDYYGYPARNSTFGSDTYGFDYHPTGLTPMKAEIDQLIKVLQRYINNSPGVDYLNHYGGTANGPSAPNNYIEGSHNRCLLYQLKAPGNTGKEVIVAINFGDMQLKVDHLIAVRNGIAPGTRFADILGKSAFPYAQVDNQNRIYIDLPAKSYSVWVQDVAPLSATLSITPAGGSICTGQSATMTATATGGTAPYTYTFSPGVSQTEPGAVGTATTSGPYSVTVTDALGLKAVANVNLTVNTTPTATLLVSTESACPGRPVTLTASPSGAAHYSFEGPSGATITPSGNEATVDKPGTYTVTVITAEGCSTTSSPVIVTVEDKEAPVVKTKDIIVYLNASGMASITPLQLNDGSFDNCTIPEDGYTLSKYDFDCTNTGENTVTLTVTDESGNSDSKTAIVTVVDNTTPTVLTQPVTIYLNANGTASLTPGQVNNGSSDNCAIASLTLDKTDFTCSNVGTNNVTLTVEDINGNVASSTATVTVEDKVAPVVNVKDITIQLDASGIGSIAATDVDNGSSDACEGLTYSLSQSSFNCSNVGANPVTLIVTDKNGNAASAPATVTVEDKVKPAVFTRNISVTLVNGVATITPAMIDNNSTDACGIASVTVNKTSFSCTNLGANTVTLSVTDNNGNTETGTAIVTVQGAIPNPVITVSRTDNTFTGGDANTIFLGYGAQALTLNAANATTGSASSFSWSPSTGLSSATIANPVFTPTAPGTYSFTVTVTNQYGCQSTATVTVTVVDVRCGNGKVSLCHLPDGNPLHENNLCLDANAIAAHLQKGCRLGMCVQASMSASKSGKDFQTEKTKKLEIKVAPNPSRSYFKISIDYSYSAQKAQLKVYDVKGRLVETRANITGNSVIEIGRNYPSGVYIVDVWLGTERKQLKLVKMAD